MNNILAKYKNGNYDVILLTNGTKIRYNHEDCLIPDFAESIDLTITTKCDGGCQFCYLSCNENGMHADLYQKFFDTLHKGQEIALNGNDLSHPELEEFLRRMKNQGVICNLTVNQKHFIREIDKLKKWYDEKLIHGLGISLTNSADVKLYNYMNNFTDAVLHTIDGLLTEEDIDNLKDRNIKLLILGYKKLGKGDAYYNNHKEQIKRNIDWLKNHILELTDHFEVVSFDNLAIDHFDLKSKIGKKEWETMYMGDEGKFTFFINAVDQTYSVSSLDSIHKHNIDNKTVDEMFKNISRI